VRSRRKKCIPTRSLVISSGQNSVRPMHLFGHNLDRFTFRLLSEEERLPINFLDVLLHTHRLFELARVRTELSDCS